MFQRTVTVAMSCIYQRWILDSAADKYEAQYALQRDILWPKSLIAAEENEVITIQDIEPKILIRSNPNINS